MDSRRGIRKRVAASSFARVAAFPSRAAIVARFDARVIGRSVRWLVRSREHTNFTYELTPLNTSYLAWWVADVSEISVSRARQYLEEVYQDADLAAHVAASTAASARRGLADRELHLHKRAGWYALVRALRPDHVVETGTDKGLGSVVLAAALLRNAAGRLTTLDINPAAGYLLSGRYAAVTDIRIGDSVTTLRHLESPVDLFLHDSWHTREHELAEYDAVTPHLSENALVLSDNAHSTDALATWAESTGRRFSYFQEVPANHWYPGGGIGAAVRRPRSSSK
jgi:predicted O-methyltransferase YrrM